MNQRSFFFSATVFSLLVCCSFILSAGEQSKKPNFVIFIADDASFHDFGCYGNKDVKTPNIDKLASEGMKFMRFYSPASVCSPLRQALLTGMYPIRNGAYPNHSRVYDGVKSLPTYLRPLGYKTVCVGKQHFGPAASFPFDLEIGMIGDEEETPSVPNERQAARAGNGGIARANPAFKKASHSNFDKLESFITDAPDKPFCAYIASNEPHSPYTKGDPFVYDAGKLTLPPYMVDTQQTREALKKYYAEIKFLDDQVGMVLGLLEKTGHANDTLVMFVSEQGSSFPHSKWTLYDVGIRVAAVVRWPGTVKPGTENAAITQYVDIVPTLIELAGGDPKACQTGRPDTFGNEGFDGVSFAEVLRGNTNKLRDYAFSQHTARGIIAGPEAYATRGVTDGKWKLIYNIHHDRAFKNTAVNAPIYKSWAKKAEDGDTFAKEQVERYVKRPQWELYNLETDPWELKNVIDVSDNASISTGLKTKLAEWMKQQGDLGDATEMKAKERQMAGGGD